MKTILETFKRVWKEEDGLGTLEILLIVSVFVAISIIFRKWFVSWFQKLIGDANSDLKDNSAVAPCAPSPTTSCAP